MRSWRRTSGSALEIGCGHGFMLAGLRDIGWRVIGIERSEESAAHTQFPRHYRMSASKDASAACEWRQELSAVADDSRGRT